MMRFFLFLTFLSLTLQTLHAENPCRCQPVSPENGPISCDHYDASELAWLPAGYAKAAKCACTLSGLPGKNSGSANCVRAFVQASHLSDEYYSNAVKNLLKEARKKLGYNPVAWAEYQLLLQAVDFAEIAHRLHQDAYAQCCCPNEPAPLWAWEAVSSIGLPSDTLCDFEIDQIETYGPCGCEGW